MGSKDLTFSSKTGLDDGNRAIHLLPPGKWASDHSLQNSYFMKITGPQPLQRKTCHVPIPCLHTPARWQHASPYHKLRPSGALAKRHATCSFLALCQTADMSPRATSSEESLGNLRNLQCRWGFSERKAIWTKILGNVSSFEWKEKRMHAKKAEGRISYKDTGLSPPSFLQPGLRQGQEVSGFFQWVSHPIRECHIPEVPQ